MMAWDIQLCVSLYVTDLQWFCWYAVAYFNSCNGAFVCLQYGVCICSHVYKHTLQMVLSLPMPSWGFDQALQLLAGEAVQNALASRESALAIKTIARILQDPSSAGLDQLTETRTQSKGSHSLITHFVSLPVAVHQLSSIDNLVLDLRKTKGFAAKIDELRAELNNQTTAAVKRSMDTGRISAHFGAIRKKLVAAAIMAGDKSVDQHSQALGSVCDILDSSVVLLGSAYITAADIKLEECMRSICDGLSPDIELEFDLAATVKSLEAR